MTGKNRRHYHCKALNSLLCADVPLRNYSLTHSSGVSLSQKFHLEGVAPTNHFGTDSLGQ